MIGVALLSALLIAAPVQDSPLVAASKAAKTGNRLPVGPAAPEIVATHWWNTSGFDLKSARGSVVLLDFWATWCGPCVAGMPHVHELARTLRDAPFKIVLLHTPVAPYMSESMAGERSIGTFIAEKHIQLPVGLVSRKSEEAYGLRGYPLYVLIDKQGRIRSTGNVMPAERVIRDLISE